MRNRLIISQITNNIRKTYHKGFYGLILSGVEQIIIENKNQVQIDFKPTIELKSGETLKNSYRLSITSSNSEEIIDLIIRILKQKPTSLKLKLILDKIEEVFKSEDLSYIRTLGLFGELLFIKDFIQIKPSHPFDLLKIYQKNETHRLIDFFKKNDFSIEIKTNIKDNNIHTFYDIAQLNFIDLNYLICSVSLNINEQGISLLELVESIENLLPENILEIFRDRVYPVLMRGVNKSIKVLDKKICFYSSSEISQINIPSEYIIENLKIDFSEKNKLNFKETLELIFH